MTRRSKKRPITVALNIVKRMYSAPLTPFGEFMRHLTPRSHSRLLAILTQANAASGTTDQRSAARRARTIRRKQRTAKK